MVHFGGWCRTVISIGNGPNSHSLGQTHSLGCTMISVGGMAQLGEWSRFNNQGHAFPRADSFSLGCIIISVGGMVQAQKSGTVILLCLGRIVQIAHG
jgi:hypothetical protein